MLPQVLDSILCQSYPLDELVVIFDNCSDESRELVVNKLEGRLRLNATNVRFNNVSKSLNRGYELVTNELVVAFVAHWIVPCNFLSLLVDSYMTGGVDLVSYSGGLWLTSKSTIRKFGPLHTYGHCEENEYIMRVALRGGKVKIFNLQRVPLPKHVYPSWRKKNVRRDLEYGLMKGTLLREYWPEVRIVSGETAEFVGKWFGSVVQNKTRFLLADLPYSLMCFFAGRPIPLASISGLIFGYLLPLQSTKLSHPKKVDVLTLSGK